MMASRLRKVVFYVLVLAVSFVTSYSLASAQVSFTNDEPQFIANNPGLAFQNFDAAMADPDTLTTCTGPVDENSNDACFQPGDILPGIAFSEIPSIPDNPLIVGENRSGNNNPANILGNNTFGDSLEVIFTQSPNAVGLVIGCLAVSNGCSETVAVEVFGPGDVLLGSTNVAVTALTDSFIGMVTQIPITRVSLDFEMPNQQVIKTILNVRFGLGAVPETIPTLSEWGLIAMAGILGIVGFMVIRRRQVTA